MNFFNIIIINLLFLISNKVSDVNIMNNIPNKEKRIRFLGDTITNSILITIKITEEGCCSCLNSEFFQNE